MIRSDAGRWPRVFGALAVVLLSPAAWAQDNPWDEAPTDEAPTDEGPTDEAPTDEAPTDEPPADEAATATPFDEFFVEEPQPEVAPVATTAPIPAAAATADGHVPQGWRIAPYGAGSGVFVGQELVVGSTGGTNATLVSARYRGEGFGFAVGVPFTAYRTPSGRTTDVGNLQIDGWYQLSDGPMWQAVGLETHFTVGESAWTWVNRPDDLWPGGGVDVVWQARTEGQTAFMYRAAFGVHAARGYEPFPNVWTRINVAAGLDRTLSKKVGLVGEASAAYWDLSPFELTGLVRFDPLEGVRARAGLVAPVFVWFGATPSSQQSGLRETTLLIDLSMAM